MYKYLLRFYKHGNMRFISHLDLGRLFRRAIKKGEIDVDYSSGYNPHEKINIVQPLSLGFESESEYFEITTKTFTDPRELMDRLNYSMPEGISFYACKRIDPASGNMSVKTDAAVYRASVKGGKEEYDKLDPEGFMSQEDIVVMKRDKKTKSMVEKSVKGYVYSLKKGKYEDGHYDLELTLRCASNESLNPVNLLEALYTFSKVNFLPENARVDRIDIMVLDRNDIFVPLFDSVNDEDF